MSQRKAWEAGTTRWYSYSLAYSRAAVQIRPLVSRQQKCWYLRIAMLHPQIGAELDKLLAPLVVVRAIAFAGGAAKQRERAIEEISALVERRERASRAA